MSLLVRLHHVLEDPHSLRQRHAVRHGAQQPPGPGAHRLDLGEDSVRFSLFAGYPIRARKNQMTSPSIACARRRRKTGKSDDGQRRQWRWRYIELRTGRSRSTSIQKYSQTRCLRCLCCEELNRCPTPRKRVGVGLAASIQVVEIQLYQCT